MSRLKRTKGLKRGGWLKRKTSFAQLRAKRERDAPGAGVTPEDRIAIFERDGWKCLRCGDARRFFLTIDHVIPLSRGGRHDPDALQTLCLWCNAWKGQRVIDFRRSSEGGSDE